MKNLLNNEGLVLVEHILLRPRNSGLAPSYHFIITLEEEILLRGSIPDGIGNIKYDDPVHCFFDYLLPGIQRENIVTFPVCPDDTDNSAVQLHLKIDEKVVAVSEKIYYDDSWGDDINNLESGINEGLEGRTWPRDKSFIKEKLSPYISSGRSIRELEGDKFLPVPDLCYDTKDTLCPELSDPYSFRLTIVIPYWPKRFNDPEFREFMEITLRRDTPAHILSRICWLDTCQMKSFEEAYRRWLDTLQLDNRHCDATAARNALIEVLKQLRSRYPEAKLHDCDRQGSESSIVILDHTRLA